MPFSILYMQCSTFDGLCLCRFLGHRERLKRLLEYSRRVQIAIVTLVILDCFIVLVELLIDLNILSMDYDTAKLSDYQSVLGICDFS